MKRRILFTVLAVFLALALAACGKTIGTGAAKQADAVTEQNTEKDSKDGKETKPDTKNDSQKENTDKSSSDGSEKEEGGQAAESQTAAPSGGQSSGGQSSAGTEQTQPAQPQPQTEAQTPAPAPAYTISIDVSGSEYGGYFGGGTFSYEYQPTAYDALVSTGLPINGNGYYVRGINGLSEFDHGPMSGWLYAVNGVTPGVSCGDYYLNDGDTVSWFYQGDE